MGKGIIGLVTSVANNQSFLLKIIPIKHKSKCSYFILLRLWLNNAVLIGLVQHIIQGVHMKLVISLWCAVVLYKTA